MAFYEIGHVSVAAAAGAAASTIMGSTTRESRIRELGTFNNAATAGNILIGRPANTPVQTGPTVGNPTDPDDAAATATAVASTWSTAPTTPTTVYRRIGLPASIAAGIVWTWNPGEEISLSKTAGVNMWLVWWNYGAGAISVQNQYAKWVD